jgi:4-diphosphocytidyl-2-C-methyl-D-erythritol kinase
MLQIEIRVDQRYIEPILIKLIQGLFLQTFFCLKLVEKTKNQFSGAKIQSIWYFCDKYLEMVVFPKAKINLGLTISGKRPDGYHDIETVFYPVPLNDAMEIVIGEDGAKHDTLTLTGLDLPCNSGENLALRAVKRLREAFSFPFLTIHLHKAIPCGAGLGGGSSDAACMLCTINRYFDLSLSRDELESFALELGSDCPFFILSQPACATGRGEILKPVGKVLEGLKIVLLNPGIQVNTREAYENWTPSPTVKSLAEIINRPV